VRCAILISLAICGWCLSAARAEAQFLHLTLLGAHGGYIVDEDYAATHKSDLVLSIPGPVKIDDFWTPPEQDVRVADRVFREMIHAAVKDPTVIFPGMKPSDAVNSNGLPDPDTYEYEQDELADIYDNYAYYTRQYVGVVIDGQKLVFCNYSIGTKTDPSLNYIFIHKTFVPGVSHFLQCRFEPMRKICSNVSFIGSWQAQER
jgi:hypothetical protein